MKKAKYKRLIKQLHQQLEQQQPRGARKTVRKLVKATTKIEPIETPQRAKPKLRLVKGSVSQTVLARARAKKPRQQRLQDDATRTAAMLARFQPYVPPPGVLPPNTQPMAMDSGQLSNQQIAWAASNLGTYWQEGLTFLGYPYLAELTLRPEYRVISQVIATEMTRKWIKFKSTATKKAEDVNEGVGETEELDGEKPVDEPLDDDGSGSLGSNVAGDAEPPAGDPAAKLLELQVSKHEDNQARQDEQQAESEERAARLGSTDDKAEKIKELKAEFVRLQVRDKFFQLVQYDGWFGRVHLYIDLQDPKTEKSFTDDREELQTAIGDGQDEVSEAKVSKGSLKRLQVVEPVWTYPQNYNSNDPLREDWYNPSTWFVMGKQVHATRLLTYVSRPVPDVLKPAYAFGGLSMSQIAKPYIDNWLQTRQSVNDVIHAFSVMVLKTDLSSTLQASDGLDGPTTGEGSDLFNRVDLFNMLRDNRGCFVIDKEGEEFMNVTTPLSSLDDLQAQSQEHMAAVSRIPLVKLLGISPHGLNASSEGELKAFYDTIHAAQESDVRPSLTKVMHFAMLNLWGEIDEEITFDFEPLEELTAKEEAELRKIEAETDDILINGCAAIHPEESRKRVANDVDSPYEDIEIADVPDKPMEDTPINIHGTEPFGKGAEGEGDAPPGKTDPGPAPPFGS